MRCGAIQIQGGEEGLLKQVGVVVAVIKKRLSVQGDVIRSVIRSLCADDPNGGPVEGEGSRGTIMRRQCKCSAVGVPNTHTQRISETNGRGIEEENNYNNTHDL